MKMTGCLKEFIRYSSFNVLGMLGLSCYILADTYFVSRGLGTNGLAALNLAIPVYSFLHGSGLMIGMGGGAKYSIQKKSKDRKGRKSNVFKCDHAGRGGRNGILRFREFFCLLSLPCWVQMRKSIRWPFPICRPC